MAKKKPELKNRIVRSDEVDPTTLVENPSNWRTHPRFQASVLDDVLEKVGWVQKITVNLVTGNVVDGHLRLKLALARGEATVPVDYTELTEEEEALVLATLDPIGALAGTDQAKLNDLLERAGAGASDALSRLLDDMKGHVADKKSSDERAAERFEDLLRRWPSKPGQVWTLGRHRLMHGDCRDEATVKRLIGSKRPALCVTDPPYGVDYQPRWRQDNLKSTRRGLDPIEGDDEFPLPDAVIVGSVIYCWMADVGMVDTCLALQAQGFELSAMIVWKKQQAIISRGNYNREKEQCFHGWRKGRTSQWIGGMKESDLWEIPFEIRCRVHPTQKPTELFSRAIRNHRGSVYDPFVGSGTVFLACEEVGRTGYGVEIDPRFVALTLDRYHILTGEKPKKEKA